MKKGPKTVPAHKPPPRASSGPVHPTWMPVVISASSSAAGPPRKSGRLASCCFPGEEEGKKKTRQVVNQKTRDSQGREAHQWLAGVCGSGRGAQNIQLRSGWAKPRPSALVQAVGGEDGPPQPSQQVCVCVCVCVCVYGLVAQSCPTLLDPMDCSLQGEPSNRPPDPPRGSPG